MIESVRQDVDLKPIIGKLGHEIEEIRIRALDNIFSKLNHNVICEVDLVQEKQLFIRLLEWFNFESCPKQRNVLELLERLVKHPSAASIIRDIGGIEFLTELRQNIDDSTYSIVDSILDYLFHLPSSQVAVHRRKCIFKAQELKSDTESVVSRTLQTSIASSQCAKLEQRGNEHSYNPLPEPQFGYFPPTESEPAIQTSPRPVTVLARCFRISTFPWVDLIKTDRNVLISSDSSLNSRDSELIKSACEFVSDVVLQDFPTEVFLQRPAIVKSLLDLVNSSGNKFDVVVSALYALSSLAENLSIRINHYRDPAFYSPGRDFYHGAARYLVQSDSQSFNSTSNSSTEHGQNHPIGNLNYNPNPLSQGCGEEVFLDSSDEDVRTLQFQQWTIPQFCVSVLRKVVVILKVPNEEVIRECIKLLQMVTKLLRNIVVADRLWLDESVLAKQLCEQLQEGLDTLGGAIYHHYHGHLAITTPPSELRFHRVAYIGLAGILSGFLEAIVPLDQCSSVLPDEMEGVLALLVEDESLSYSASAIRERALPYLRYTDPAEHELYLRACHVCDCMKSTCSFLSRWPDQANEQLGDLSKEASEALDSLPYHLHLPYVKAVVDMTAYTFSKKNINPVAGNTCKQTLLKLMAHPMDVIRSHTYNTCLNLVKDALGISNITEPASTAHQKASFIMQADILYEITCFGMIDNHTEKAAAEIILYLLQSELLLPQSKWQQFLDVLVSVLPFLQIFSSTETEIGKCLLTLLNAEQQKKIGGPPLLEKFRGTLRLLFATNARVRTEAVGRLAWFLTYEKDSLYKRPLFSELQLSNVGSLFLVDTPMVLQEDCSSKSIFREQGLSQIYQIYESEHLEMSVRKSAADQLAIMLQEKSMHQHFLAKGGLEKTLEMLQNAVKKPERQRENPLLPLMPSMIKMLRLLLQWNNDLRHKLAHEPELYYVAVRCGLLHPSDESCRREVAVLLGLLLFDEVASVQMVSQSEDMDENDDFLEGMAAFSLPAVITERYKLPFQCAKHHQTSPHRIDALPDYDPLGQGALAEKIKFGWSKAWYGRVEEIMRTCKQGQEAQKQFKGLFKDELLLNSADRIILPASHFPSAVMQCIHDVENATNHPMVTKSLRRLSSYLTVGRYYGVNQVFESIKWKDALSRFLKTIPSSVADEELFTEILNLLDSLIRNEHEVPNDLLTWLSDLVHNSNGALLNLVCREPHVDKNDAVTHIHRQLNRQVLHFIQAFVGKVPYNLHRNVIEFLNSNLTKNVVSRLRVADVTHFNNLASLENSLLCLSHITARPGFSVSNEEGCADLHYDILENLVRIITAFHAGRGESAMLYMGKGVTLAASICLRHLAFEMATQRESKDWPLKWLFSQSPTDGSTGQSGLHWLTPLWMYRDAETRAAGLGIAVALSSTDTGRTTLGTQCLHVSGGVWGIAFKFLFDQFECCVVREQAALLLVNLTSQSLLSDNKVQDDPLRGPIVTLDDGKILKGLPALLALLHHHHFYQEILAMLSSYYPQPLIHPVTVAQEESEFHFDLEMTMTTQASPYHPGLHSSGISIGTGQSTRSVASSSESRGSHSAENDAEVLADNTDYQNVVTPCLLTNISQLLSNLVIMDPNNTLDNLEKKMIVPTMLGAFDVKLMSTYVAELKKNPRKKSYLLVFRDLLRVQIAILKLVKVGITHQHKWKTVLLQEKHALTQIIQLLSIAYEDDADTAVLCESLWNEIFALLSFTLQVGGHSALEAMTPVMIKNWPVITGRCVSIIQEKKQMETKLWRTTLTFIAVTLTSEGQRISSGARENEHCIANILDTRIPTAEGDISVCSGVSLCQSLIKLYDAVALRPHAQAFSVKQAVANALKSVLGLSETAKASAMEAGFVESLCEQLKSLHVKLTMEVLDGPQLLLQQQNGKKDGHHLINQVVLTMDLLRNFLHNNCDVKVAAYETGLSSVIHKLWAWGQVDNALMMAIVTLLATYTAKCPQACSSLAFTSTQMTVDRTITNVPQTSNSSLVHCLIKLVQKESSDISHSGNPELLKVAFNMLTTLSLSQECRGIMWKSNFLLEFSKLCPNKKKKTKLMKTVEGLWLELFVNLSFSNDGQNTILKIKDVLMSLLEFGASQSSHHRHCATLIIRNLCFQNNNKAKLLANEKLVPYLLQCLEVHDDQVQIYASSAILATVYNNQKAKVLVKTNEVMRRLQETYNQVINLQQPTPVTSRTAENIHNTLIILRG